jgi:3-phosphoshikimate 1-carboxyvinyltransferase
VPPTIAIRPVRGPVVGNVRLPGSKSYTNRALPIAALAEGRSTITGALFSDDTRYMAGALRTLGIGVEADEAEERFVVDGLAGVIPAEHADLDLGLSGTAMRFLCAIVALGHGHYRLDGTPRARRRPIAPLLEALSALGVDARSEADDGCPPVVIRADGCPGGHARMAGDISSQYFSGLLLAAPYMRDGLDLDVVGVLVSRPYLDITADIMTAFGVELTRDGYDRFRVAPGQRYRARDYQIEPDASNATYFLAAAALTGGRVRVEGLGRRSAQGDIHFLDTLQALGCETDWGDDFLEVQGPSRLHGADLNLADTNDTAQTVAALAPFCTGPVTLRGLEHTRHQETDRVAAVTAELRKLGARVDEHADGWTIWPSALHAADIATYDDHRMAMAFGLVGLRVPGLRIENPACVAKTFPDFFERFAALTDGAT